jgi:dihydroneopterin aldolase
MSDHLVIKALEFQGHIGITAEERRNSQPIGIDIELDYPEGAMANASKTDDIARAVDYARVSARMVEIGLSREFKLLETLADEITAALFAEFPIAGIRLWVKKLVPPIKNIRESVGVRIERRRPSRDRSSESSLAPHAEGSPAPFLIAHAQELPKGRILDVAAGRGRNALYLASQGFTVEAFDRDEAGLAALQSTVRERNLHNVTIRAVDLETNATLPKEHYDAVIVFFYLQRNLFPALIDTLRPGGVLMYETFLIDNHLRHNHPRRREFCLEHNELLRLIGDLRLLYYDEGEHEGAHGADPVFTARLLARKE